MFISLKWKAVVFLSVILVLISTAWIGQNVYKTILNYETDIREGHQSHQQILDQMMSDNSLKFFQFARLISGKAEIQGFLAAPPDFSMSEFLEKQWASLNISIGLDYITVLDSKGQKFGEAYNRALADSMVSLSSVLEQYNTSELRRKSHSFVYCQETCIQFVMEPFIFSGGEEGVIVLGQNMADIVWRYHEASSSDIVILIANDNLPERKKLQHALPRWNSHVWTMSRFDNLQPVLEAYSVKNDISSINTFELFTSADEQYLLKSLNLLTPNKFGAHAYFINVVNETELHQKLTSSIWSWITTGLLGLILSEIVLIFLMLGPIRRLMNIAEALNLLPEHRYQEAGKLVLRKTSYINDELTQLEDNTRLVSNQLEVLYDEVQKTNGDLNAQVKTLSRSRAFLTRLLDNPNVYILTQTKEFNITLSNKKFKRDIKSSDSNFLKLFSNQKTKKTFIKEIANLTKESSKVYQNEVIMQSTGEQALLISWSHALVEDENGNEMVLSIGMDSTQHRKDEIKLKWLANHDSLTKIGNRRAFMHDLRGLLDDHTQGAVVIIDVNRFKQVNDIYGHVAGDEVLIDIAQVLKNKVLAVGSISRLSGDEFTVILPSMSVGDLGVFLESLSGALKRKVTLRSERVVEYNVSIGAALFPDDGKDYQTLIAHADMAMYQAKKTGHNQWHIFNESDDNSALLKKDHDLSGLIKMALDDDLFQLVFQPILSIDTGRVQHYETLLRLKDEKGNAISPAEFIPVSERLGLIRDIDSWVLDHALIRLSDELVSNPELKFSINVSAPTLQMSDYPMTFVDALHKHNVDAESVIVELTETAYIENFNQVLDNLMALTGEGAGIALDDFGVGFSSFSYLKQLPLKYVKLDGSYIKNLKNHPDNQAFVKSVSEMVRAFGMRTIAEFVEDETTLTMLDALGVTYAQGYYIGRPESDLLAKDFRLEIL